MKPDVLTVRNLVPMVVVVPEPVVRMAPPVHHLQTKPDVLMVRNLVPMAVVVPEPVVKIIPTATLARPGISLQAVRPPKPKQGQPLKSVLAEPLREPVIPVEPKPVRSKARKTATGLALALPNAVEGVPLELHVKMERVFALIKIAALIAVNNAMPVVDVLCATATVALEDSQEVLVCVGENIVLLPQDTIVK